MLIRGISDTHVLRKIVQRQRELTLLQAQNEGCNKKYISMDRLFLVDFCFPKVKQNKFPSFDSAITGFHGVPVKAAGESELLPGNSFVPHGDLIKYRKHSSGASHLVN